MLPSAAVSAFLALAAAAAPATASAAAASSAVAAAAAYTLVYTDGHFNMSSEGIKCGGDGTMPFWIRTAQFSAAGDRLTQPADFSTELCGAGYLSVAGAKLTFASMDLTTPGNIGNVATYFVDLSLPAPQTPAKAFADISPLLAACGAADCKTASTFHGTFSPAGDRLFFAYRVCEFGLEREPGPLCRHAHAHAHAHVHAH